MTQWRVATLQPPHLAAICPWEGYVDYYRDSTHHGGILSSGFANYWWPKQCLSVQHGNGKTPHRDRVTGRLVTGDKSLTDEELIANRTDYPSDILRHSLDSAWWRERTPVLNRINIPVFSAGNWGGPGMHLRGNIEGYLGVSSKDKWLSLHTGKHWESFYLPRYVAAQKRFFNRFLRDEPNGWDAEPRVKIVVRDPRGEKLRTGNEFPCRRQNQFVTTSTSKLTPWSRPIPSSRAKSLMTLSAPASTSAPSLLLRMSSLPALFRRIFG